MLRSLRLRCQSWDHEFIPVSVIQKLCQVLKVISNQHHQVRDHCSLAEKTGMSLQVPLDEVFKYLRILFMSVRDEIDKQLGVTVTGLWW